MRMPKMNIELTDPYAKMSETGSSLLRLMQNTSTPRLELLVRESIQNSLDAGDKKSCSVKVNVTTGSVPTAQIADFFDKIQTQLVSRYPNCEFIALRDTGTTGLTGPVRKQDIADSKLSSYGNYLKLVTEICKAQDTAGAGGSWGLGKTVYFRIGAGIVIYYSRIRNDDGSYESRLSAACVQDERDENSYFLPEEKKLRRGIAWWGKYDNKYESKQVIPVTDETEITIFLNRFGLHPFESEETGTEIIIPFINKDKLLGEYKSFNSEGNSINHQDDLNLSLEERIRQACQRWYAPRLNNKNYDGQFLEFSVNNRILNDNELIPLFLLIRKLYNFRDGNSDNLFGQSVLKSNEIKIYKTFENKVSAGWINWCEVSKQDLGMIPPDNMMNPYIYICKTEEDSRNGNSPIVLCCRKPGMVVSYFTDGSWIGKLNPSPDTNCYLIAMFIANSNAIIEGNKQTLEEYIRSNEHADHMDWFDNSNLRYNIIDRIRKNLAKKINEQLSHKESNNSEDVRLRGVGKKIADVLFPSGDFAQWDTAFGGGEGSGGTGGGYEPSLSPSSSASNHGKTNKNVTITVVGNPVFTNDFVMLPVKICFGINRQASLLFEILTEGKTINCEEWENMFNEPSPLKLLKISIDKFFIRKNKRDLSSNNLITEPNQFSDNFEITGMNVTFKRTVNYKIANGLDITLSGLEPRELCECYATIYYSSKGVLGSLKLG